MNITQNAQEKTIFILLMEYKTHIPRLYQLLTAKKFTHAAIGIDNKYFFSFVIKGGFRSEKPWLFTNTKKKTKSCALYSLDVTDEVYNEIQAHLAEFKASKKQYRYSFLGALLCFLKIPHRFKNSYFCSQFVAELLSSSGALELSKPPSLYHPHDFADEKNLSLCFQGSLDELAMAV